MKASEIIERYEAYCPRELSMEGDISGLQIGTLDKEVNRVMIALDVRETTVAEAIEKNVDLIIVKHAPIFRPLMVTGLVELERLRSNLFRNLLLRLKKNST